MNRHLWVFAAGILLAAEPSWAAAPQGSATPEAPSATITTLKNGIRLVLAPDPRAAAVDVAIWYDAGSRHDRRGKTGLAHLFEHLMFRGSAKFGAGEHVRRVRAEGGSSGALSTPDLTAFYETLPPDALELAFQLESDRMNGLQITPEALAAERSQVSNERLRRGSPAGLGLDLLYAKAWQGHPYARSLYGAESEVARLTVQDCREFYRARFGPDRAVITVVGRFDPEQARSLATKYFGSLKPTAAPSEAKPAVDPQTTERRASASSASPTRILMVGWRIPPRTDPDWPVYAVLVSLLTRSNEAPLARALVVDRPLCLSVQGDVDSRRDGSLFYLNARVAPDADSAEVEERMFKELGRLLVEPVKAADLERARRQSELAVWLGMQTSRDKAQAIGVSTILTGDPNAIGRLPESLGKVSAADVQRVATELDPARRVVVWLAPAGGWAGGRP